MRPYAFGTLFLTTAMIRFDSSEAILPTLFPKQNKPTSITLWLLKMKYRCFAIVCLCERRIFRLLNRQLKVLNWNRKRTPLRSRHVITHTHLFLFLCTHSHFHTHKCFQNLDLDLVSQRGAGTYSLASRWALVFGNMWRCVVGVCGRVEIWQTGHGLTITQAKVSLRGPFGRRKAL